MTQYTKRLIEALVVTTITISVVMTQYENNRDRQFLEKVPEIVQSINQTIWEKYQPGNVKSYKELFGEERSSRQTFIIISYNEWFGEERSFQQSFSWQEAILALQRTGFGTGFLYVPEAPEFVDTNMKFYIHQVDRVRQVLDQGILIPAPDEPEFTEISTYVNYDIVMAADVLVQIANRYWIDGEFNDALRILSDILRLGDALKAQLLSTGQFYYRQQIYEKAITDYNRLIWTNPSFSENKLLLQKIQPFTFETLPFANSPLFYICTTPERAKSIEKGSLATLLNALRINNRIDDSIRAVLTDAGIWPADDFSFAELNSYLFKWTTLPAVYKRSEQIPDWFFEDPFFPKETAKAFPRIVYIASRILFHFNTQDQYVHKTINRLEAKNMAIQASAWARVWRDENGRWPTAEEFKAEAPDAEYCFWLASTSHRLFEKEFKKLNETNSFITQLFDLESDTDEYKPGVITYQVHPTLPDEFKTWVKGIYKP